jgi:hypothetical protein
MSLMVARSSSMKRGLKKTAAAGVADSAVAVDAAALAAAVAGVADTAVAEVGAVAVADTAAGVIEMIAAAIAGKRRAAFVATSVNFPQLPS